MGQVLDVGLGSGSTAWSPGDPGRSRAERPRLPRGQNLKAGTGGSLPACHSDDSDPPTQLRDMTMCHSSVSPVPGTRKGGGWPRPSSGLCGSNSAVQEGLGAAPLSKWQSACQRWKEALLPRFLTQLRELGRGGGRRHWVGADPRAPGSPKDPAKPVNSSEAAFPAAPSQAPSLVAKETGGGCHGERRRQGPANHSGAAVPAWRHQAGRASVPCAWLARGGQATLSRTMHHHLPGPRARTLVPALPPPLPGEG